MAVPLTTVWATQLLYSKQQLAGLQEFNLHLVGASHYDFEHVSVSSNLVVLGISSDTMKRDCLFCMRVSLGCYWIMGIRSLVGAILYLAQHVYVN